MPNPVSASALPLRAAFVAADGALAGRIEPGIPSDAEAVLARLYGSFHASLPQLEVEGDTAGVQAWIASRAGEIRELWLFRREGTSVRVLPEAIPIDAACVESFAAAVFAAHPRVRMLIFNAVYPTFSRLALPCLRFHASDDCVLALPGSVDAWLASLGKATRRNLKRYLHRFEQAYPDFRYEVFEQGAAPAQLLHEIVMLNHKRMTAKGKVSGVDETEAARMLQLVRRCGFLGVGTIAGKVVCGAIVYRTGDNFFSFLRAHDPAYNDWRLGLIGARHLVETCIARGGRELHFMWGKEAHKRLLGGEERVLERVFVFRSRLHALREARRVAGTACSAWARTTRQRIVAMAGEDDARGRMLARLLDGAKRLKRGLRRA